MRRRTIPKDDATLSAASVGSHGVTLRDVFAAAAMAGMLARPDIDDEPLEYHFLCDHAYKWADEMLRARESSG
jgi:hypothetical protein